MAIVGGVSPRLGPGVLPHAVRVVGDASAHTQWFPGAGAACSLVAWCQVLEEPMSKGSPI